MRGVHMKSDILHQIKGYLSGISNMNTFLGVCYGHEYGFFEVDGSLEKATMEYLANSNIGNDYEVIGHNLISNWQDELFPKCNNWFFGMIHMRNYSVQTVNKQGNSDYAENNKDYNYVTTGFLKLLNDFFEGQELQVFELKLDPEYEDEFAWNQYFFVCKNKVYVLYFYQWG
jgi:hypothetical protein